MAASIRAAPSPWPSEGDKSRVSQGCWTTTHNNASSDVEVAALLRKSTTPTMRFLISALAYSLALLSCALAQSSSGNKVLVLLDPALEKENYSIFFSALESESRPTAISFCPLTPAARSRVRPDVPRTKGRESRHHRVRHTQLRPRHSLHPRNQVSVSSHNIRRS